MINASSSATTSISSDPYQLPSERFSTIIRAEPVCLTPFFSCSPSHSHIYIIPTLVIQNLELQLGPDGQIVRGNLMFLLATKDQESSRGSQPPQQLLSSTICAHPVRRLQQVVPATNYQILALSRQSHHSREGSLVPTTLHHHYNHLVPFFPCPHAIPQYPPFISIWTHRFSTLPHGIAGCPAPATTRLTTCAARRGSPTWVGL